MESADVILIIEDDAHIAGLVAQVLREAGFEPALVRDVGAARDWCAAGHQPAAILSDLMVAGSSGPDRLVAELAGLFPSIPVALLTGVPPRRRAALGVQHARVIEKPFELETLLDAVRGMLGSTTA
jgi:DNA-binding NtrC family response regulator